MIKKITSFLFLALGVTAGANAQNARTGEVDVTIPDDVVVTETDPAVLAKTYLPRISKMTTFVVTRDDTDNIGIRTVECEQYVNGVQVPGREMILHYCKGKLMFITGMVATSYMTDPILNNIPSASYGKGMWVATDASHGTEPKYTVRIVDGVAHTAYSVIEGTDRVYYDSQTGEEIERFTLKKDIDKASYSGETAKGKGMTFFYGEREMNVVKLDENKYALHDNDRKIYTVDGSTSTINYFNTNEVNDEKPIDAFAEITSTAADFGNPGLSATISKVKISKFDETFASENLKDKPYVYAVIKKVTNGESTEVAVSNTANTSESDYTSGVTVTFPTPWACAMPDTATLANKTNNTYYQIDVFCSASAETDKDNDSAVGNTVTMYLVFNTLKCSTGKCTVYVEKELTACQPALDVHWGLQKVMDYHKEKFGRNSFDNKGTRLIAQMNKGDNTNASASPLADNYTAGYMNFGLGQVSLKNNNGEYPYVDLETIGHEFNHLCASKLKYQGESGALDESYADIMGKNIEAYAGLSTPAWEASKILYVDPSTKPMRSFDNPKTGAKDPAPAYYKGENWAGTGAKDDDNGGVHTNSSVQNHWYYIMCTGGTFTTEGTNPKQITVTGIGREIMEQIVFKSLVNYGVENLTYTMARKNSIRVAQEFTKAAGWETALTDVLVAELNKGWDAVGVPEKETAQPNAVADGGVETNKSRYRQNIKGDQVKGEDLILSCTGKGITVTCDEDLDPSEIVFGILFEEVNENQDGKDSITYWLSDRATIDSTVVDNTINIKSITVEVDDDLEPNHTYQVVPVYWYDVDENLPDDKYWQAVDEVLEEVAFPKGYKMPTITIEPYTTGINTVGYDASQQGDKTCKKIVKRHVVIEKNGKQFNAVGARLN